MAESDSRADPSALRWLIGHELRSARIGAGKKQADAAQLLGCVQSRINSFETAKVQQPPEEVKKLLRFYGTDVDQVDRIVSLAARADQSTWWAPFSDILPDWFRTFIGLEGLATAQFAYESKLIPGQIQTADY
ncbi:MAG: helix-turn-helix domain-containing protein, partial [Mycobacteriaceae bacterium]|nr:helix-turn-helix domain-containing protein [Mycobacteriaceae bacterium]